MDTPPKMGLPRVIISWIERFRSGKISAPEFWLMALRSKTRIDDQTQLFEGLKSAMIPGDFQRACPVFQRLPSLATKSNLSAKRIRRSCTVSLLPKMIAGLRPSYWKAAIAGQLKWQSRRVRQQAHNQCLDDADSSGNRAKLAVCAIVYQKCDIRVLREGTR